MNNLCDDVNKVLGDSFELYSKIQKFNDVVNILVIEGFSIFTWSKIEQLCQWKFHIHLPYEEASARRKVRVYENFPSDVLGYFDICVWSSYESYFHMIKGNKDVKVMDGLTAAKNNFNFILNKMKNFVH